MTKLYLGKTSYGSQTRGASSDDDWDRGDTSTSWSFGKISLSSLDRYEEEIFETGFDVKSGDIIYLVIPVWSTGDSFGHDDGACSEVFGSFKTFEEASELKNKLKIGEYSILGRDIYIPWEGYFESLDYIEIHSGVVT